MELVKDSLYYIQFSARIDVLAVFKPGFPTINVLADKHVLSLKNAYLCVWKYVLEKHLLVLKCINMHLHNP
jgi:hypothetical protein